MPPAAHTAELIFTYETASKATVIATAVQQETGEIADDRSHATVTQDDAAVTVEISATDLSALRAGLNTWTTLIAVAEQTTSLDRS